MMENLLYYFVLIVVVGVVGSLGMSADRAAKWADENSARPGARLAKQYAKAVQSVILVTLVVGAALLVGWGLYSCMTSRPSITDCTAETDSRGTHAECN
jgi:hypothetical protein